MYKVRKISTLLSNLVLIQLEYQADRGRGSKWRIFGQKSNPIAILRHESLQHSQVRFWSLDEAAKPADGVGPLQRIQVVFHTKLLKNIYFSGMLSYDYSYGW